MSGDDILDRAEDLAERYNSSGFIHKEATLLLPELIAEIKHLRGDICYPGQCVQMIDAEETICEQRRTIDEQAAYVTRLEAAYLRAQAAWTFYADISGGARWYEAKPDEVAVCNQVARETLERIKRGEQE